MKKYMLVQSGKRLAKTGIYTLLLACGIAQSHVASAQKGLEFGVRYMLTESALFNKSDANAGTELDYANTLSYLSGGISAAYKFDRHMGIEVDVLYSRQGQNYTGDDMFTPNDNAYNSQVAFQALLNDKPGVGAYKAKAELNCIKIPVLFNLTTNSKKMVYYTVSAGPQINMLKSAVYEINVEDVELPGTGLVPNDVYRKVTVDGVLALGAGFNLSKHLLLTTQVRMDYGFQDVEKKDVTFSFLGAEQKYYSDGRSSTHNATAALMVGFSYKL